MENVERPVNCLERTSDILILVSLVLVGVPFVSFLLNNLGLGVSKVEMALPFIGEEIFWKSFNLGQQLFRFRIVLVGLFIYFWLNRNRFIVSAIIFTGIFSSISILFLFFLIPLVKSIFLQGDSRLSPLSFGYTWLSFFLLISVAFLFLGESF